MRRYETIVIIDPDLTEEQRTPLFDRIEGIISENGGLLIKNDQWGLKKLAYEVKKKARGFYARLDYGGTGALVNELERMFRIDDRVLKYMTVLQDPKPDVEKIRQEMAQAQLKAEQKAEPVVEGTIAAEAEPQPQSSETSEGEQEFTETAKNTEEQA
ncbi:MAG: 30S ribosomal protein S6 [Deltaproteobacteria bacterium]|nr:30S ribosomal protein S6 [Deltaproteobacteria bacterium]MBW1963017.1 30S ribosomal protein S6 [Deltaproteobacteria bacterium]MBW2153646.1 30S ribosomal protein S6 [Deltaproteobacteria bacterium]